MPAWTGWGIVLVEAFVRPTNKSIAPRRPAAKANPTPKVKQPPRSRWAARTVAQIRIVWRRPWWTAETTSKSRVFERKARAMAFLERLRKRGKLAWVIVEGRIVHVGEWREVGE